MNVIGFEDVIFDKVPTLSSLRIGHICDAQDYLGSWHLSIVIDNAPQKVTFHFLPFNKANRDEEFTLDD